jgi:hypothetical protein
VRRDQSATGLAKGVAVITFAQIVVMGAFPLRKPPRPDASATGSVLAATASAA